jgi:hypothetical protein
MFKVAAPLLKIEWISAQLPGFGEMRSQRMDEARFPFNIDESMFIRLLIEVAAVAGVSTLGLLLTLANYKLVGQVNALAPRELHSTYAGGDVLKLLHLHREYRRLVPDGNLHFKIRIMLVLMFACMLAAAYARTF